MPRGQYYENERLYTGCLNRCFCSWEVDDLTMQLKREVPSNADLVTLPVGSYYTELQLEVAEMLYQTSWPRSRVGDHDDVSVLQVIPDLGEPNEVGGYASIYTTGWVEASKQALDPGNRITCEGDLPSFLLSSPYTNANFTNPQELCAVQWSGGLS